MKTCSVEGCERKHSGRGWCSMHYQRWYNNGDLELRLGPHATEHGTINEYMNFGCRCEACRQAQHDYFQNRKTPCPRCGKPMTHSGRYRPGAKCLECHLEERIVPLEQAHGTLLGYKKGCRCEACVKVDRDGRQGRRQRNKVPCIDCGRLCMNPKDKLPGSRYSRLALCYVCVNRRNGEVRRGKKYRPREEALS